MTIRHRPPKTSTNGCIAENTTYLISCLCLPSVFSVVSTMYLDLFYLFFFHSQLSVRRAIGEEVWWLINAPFPKPQSNQLLVLYDVVSLLKSMCFIPWTPFIVGCFFFIFPSPTRRSSFRIKISHYSLYYQFTLSSCYIQSIDKIILNSSPQNIDSWASMSKLSIASSSPHPSKSNPPYVLATRY